MNGQHRAHELGVPEVHRRRGVDHGLLRRDAEEDRDVTELQVGVDQRDRFVDLARHRDGDVDRDRALADTTLGREHDDEPARLEPPARGHGNAGRRGREELADTRDRLCERLALLLELDGVTRARTERVLEEFGGQLLDDEDRPELRVRRREPVDLLEAERSAESRPEHRDHGPARTHVLHDVLDGVELLRPGELQADPHPQARVGFDDRDVVPALVGHLARSFVLGGGHRHPRVHRPEAGTAVPDPALALPLSGFRVRYNVPALFSWTTRKASSGDTSNVMRPLCAATAEGWPLPPVAVAAVS